MSPMAKAQGHGTSSPWMWPQPRSLQGWKELVPLPAVAKAAWHLPRVYLDTPEPAADIFFICFLSDFMPFW